MQEEEFETIQEVPVDEQFITALSEAGASSLMQEVVKVSDEDLPDGVDRNSARLEVQKYCYWEGEVSAEAISSKQHYGGHFFQALWSGDVSDAFARADLNNKQILESIGYNWSGALKQ